MGYLDNSTITVDAILTNRGRELLSLQGSGGASQFEITKFALADDEVDYRLYNSAHPLGTNAAGRIIEKMPVLEASTDDTLVMKYKLVTITGNEAAGDGGSKLIPTLIPNISLTGNSTTIRTSPNANPAFIALDNIQTRTTSLGGAAQETGGYTVVIGDSTIAVFENGYTGTTTNRTSVRGPATATGTRFKIIPAPSISSETATTTITIYGNNTGATTTFNLSVTP